MTRQSYIMAVVSKEERSAAAGITGVARTTGAAISPLFVGFMFARPSWINLPSSLPAHLRFSTICCSIENLWLSNHPKSSSSDTEARDSELTT